MHSRELLERTLHHAADYLEGLKETPVGATADVHELRRRIGRALADEGVPAERVIDELVEDVAPGLLGSAGGRFFAWVIGASLPSALSAEWLTSTWDQTAVLYSTGPSAAIVEEVCGEWLKELLGIPASAGFALVTGCQMAHATCLAAARNALLAKHGHDVEELGLAGSPPIRFLCSERHGSIDRAVRLLGFGSRSIEVLPANEAGLMDPGVLAGALDPKIPTVVLLQAGDINTGAFDDFEALVPIAHGAGAWVHLDGAFGLWAAASPSQRHHMHGAEAADSWATDGHKWLNVPYDSGYAFVADADAQRAAMGHRASYLTHDSEARDEIDWNPEWSRRSRGFATYAAIRELGRSGIADLVDRTCRHAASLVEGIGALDGAEVVSRACINQGLVRFLDPNKKDHDRFTDVVLDRIEAGGEALFSGTHYRGRRCMRISVCSWLTDDEDVERTIRAVKAAIEA